jgi:sugar O-acyltransferase (sialic acid O-acetyltransferase NeuD family)
MSINPVECVVLAAGGHALSIIDALLLDKSIRAVGVVDPRSDVWGTSLLGVPVIGGDDQLPDLWKQGIRRFVNGMGSTHSTDVRRRLHDGAITLGFLPQSITHPTAVLSPAARRGAGVQLMANSVVGPNAVLGNNVLINTGAIVEHDCIVGDHVHVATGAVLTGGVVVGDGAHIGAGATVIQNVTIGARAIVAAGAVVVTDVADGDVVMGVPAKKSWRTAA